MDSASGYDCIFRLWNVVSLTLALVSTRLPSELSPSPIGLLRPATFPRAPRAELECPKRSFRASDGPHPRRFALCRQPSAAARAPYAEQPLPSRVRARGASA